MNTYHCSYSWTGGWGAFQEYDAIVIAETESVALGLLLEAYSDTSACDWSIEKVDTNHNTVVHVNSRCS